MTYTQTRAVQVPIGERPKPQPGGQPGYLRVDTVHQGDLDGIKGAYHINAVDEVTQWQVVGAVEAITLGDTESAQRMQEAKRKLFLGFRQERKSECETGERRGNARRWDTRKTKTRFPSCPTALGNRCTTSTFPPRR